MKSIGRALLAVTLLLLPVTSHAAESYTDESINEYFAKNDQVRRSHGLMAGQKERLEAILSDFLEGDSEGIASNSAQVSDVMRTALLMETGDVDQEAKVWQALSEVVLQARLLEAQAKKPDYKKAYEHFSLLTGQCIQCHQLARSWGKFPEPEPAAPAPAEAQAVRAQSPVN